jgi:multidrug efflux pump
MRQSLGTAVFAGMLGVTAFGLLFTPAFYAAVRKIGRKKPQAGPDEVAPASHIDANRDDHASGVRVPSRAI